MSTTFQIVYWRDIPAQVRAQIGRQRVTRPLSARFQEAIDQAAMFAGATSTDAYLEDWRTSDWQPGEGEPESLANQLAAQIEADYPDARLQSLKMNKGYASSN
jgi:hypothetical protein